MGFAWLRTFQQASNIEAVWCCLHLRCVAGDSLKLVRETIRDIRVSNDVLAEAANSTILLTRYSILLMQVALPNEFLVESAR